MRYKDDIHCYGSEVIQAVRADALKETGSSDYYALHIRRGDFQFKDVKIGADEILKNLNFPDKNGDPIIPKGALVYLSTDGMSFPHSSHDYMLCYTILYYHTYILSLSYIHLYIHIVKFYS